MFENHAQDPLRGLCILSRAGGHWNLFGLRILELGFGIRFGLGHSIPTSGLLLCGEFPQTVLVTGVSILSAIVKPAQSSMPEVLNTTRCHNGGSLPHRTMPWPAVLSSSECRVLRPD